MINVNDNKVNENSNQSDLSDEDPAQSSDAVQTSASDDLRTQPPLTDKSADSAQESGDSMENVMTLYEESFKRFAEGEVVTGRIISFDKDHVLVDIGYKSKRQIQINEFKNEKGNITATVNNTVEVMVE